MDFLVTMTKAENIIISISGHKGSGKTTLLTFFLYSEYTEKIKEKVFSNYGLKFHFKWLNAFDMIENTQLLENSSIGIDELHEYADSRSSGTLQNKRISDFFLQSRHFSSNIYYTTQFIDQVDKRIRRITDIDIFIENMYIDSDNDGDNDLFSFVIYDTRNREITKRVFYATPIFKLFDSKERINPFMVSKEKQKEITSKIEKMNDEKIKSNK